MDQRKICNLKGDNEKNKLNIINSEIIVVIINFFALIIQKFIA